MRVLIVDEESLSQRALAALLRSNGVVVDHSDRGADAIEQIKRYDYDVVLADFTLPDMEGADMVRRLRSARVDTPVMIQAPAVRPQARERAFAAGVDDFITRPYDPEEIFARMQAIVRRSKGYSQPTLRCGSLELSLDSREVLVAGTPVRLTAKEFAILELLVLRKGMVLTKEVFLNHLYGGMDEPEVKIIDVFICKLRKKLAEAGAPNVIGTIWGRGYMVRDAMSHPMLAAHGALPAMELVSA